MNVPWYFILIYVVGGYILLSIFDKYKIIKQKSLRYFIVIFVYSFIAWGLYDLILASK